MHGTSEVRLFYTQISQIVFVWSAVILINLWGAIAPASAQSSTLKQLLLTQVPQNSSILEGAIAPGQTREYLLFGTARQNLTINLASAQLNAVFTILAYDGGVLTSNTTSWIGSLQTIGLYKIILSSSRGGAVYSMRYILM